MFIHKNQIIELTSKRVFQLRNSYFWKEHTTKKFNPQLILYTRPPFDFLLYNNLYEQLKGFGPPSWFLKVSTLIISLAFISVQ